MNLREILKPTAKKITWTIGIGITAIFILFLSGVSGMGCNFNYPCPFNDISAFISLLLSPPLGILFNYNLFYTLLNGIIPTDLFLISLGISIFYWYLLSCLIIWKYDKLRKYYFIIGAILIVLMCLYASLESYTFQPHGLEGIKNDACRALVQTNNCGVGTDTIAVNYDVDESGTVAMPNDNLLAFCTKIYERTTDSACKALCGCPDY